ASTLAPASAQFPLRWLVPFETQTTDDLGRKPPTESISLSSSREFGCRHPRPLRSHHCKRVTLAAPAPEGLRQGDSRGTPTADVALSVPSDTPSSAASPRTSSELDLPRSQ